MRKRWANILMKRRHFLNKKKEKNIIKIQSQMRVHLSQQKFNSLLQHVITLQAIWRGYCLRKGDTIIPNTRLRAISIDHIDTVKELQTKNNKLLEINQILEEENKLLKISNKELEQDNLNMRELVECPITFEIPSTEDILFCTVDGRVYDADALHVWAEANDGRLISPLTRQHIPIGSLYPFYAGAYVKSRTKLNCYTELKIIKLNYYDLVIDSPP
mgnify:CR=1 FL=1|tara:strand:+ start:1699 stop:2346 length:648 start_codon:yes stop_codon:yes gene_type:complete